MHVFVNDFLIPLKKKKKLPSFLSGLSVWLGFHNITVWEANSSVCSRQRFQTQLGLGLTVCDRFTLHNFAKMFVYSRLPARVNFTFLRGSVIIHIILMVHVFFKNEF